MTSNSDNRRTGSETIRAPERSGTEHDGSSATNRPAGNNRPGTAASAHDVALSLRAQASKAAQATKQAASRLQKTSVNSSPAPDPAVDARKTNLSTDEPRGAAAARLATSPPKPPIPPPPSASDGVTSNHPTRTASGPVPPPSLVAERNATRSSAGAAVVAPPAAAGSDIGLDAQDGLEGRPARRTAATEVRQTARVPTARRPVRVRKARLRLLRVDPWSVMKTSFLLSVALGIMMFVAVAVLWSILDAAGVFDSLRELIDGFTATDTDEGYNIDEYIELSRVLGFTTLIAVADVVLITALATLGAFLYNLSASLLGGLELTLAEDD